MTCNHEIIFMSRAKQDGGHFQFCALCGKNNGGLTSEEQEIYIAMVQTLREKSKTKPASADNKETMTMNLMQVTVAGATRTELVKNLSLVLKELGGVTTPAAAPAAKPAAAPAAKAPAKKAPPAPAKDELDELGELDADAAVDDLLGEDDSLGSFDDEPADPPPAPAAKKGKAKEIDDKTINAAAYAYAAKHGRPATKEMLLKKFGTQSIAEIPADKRASAMLALKV